MLLSQPDHPPRSYLWTLPSALGIRRRDVVSFVGGGGKTTVLFRLASALAAKGWQVISTTTTHLGRDEASLAPSHLWLASSFPDARRLQAGLSTSRHILVTGPPVGDGSKWGGVPVQWIGEIAQLPEVDAVLVEADGARGKPLKAPAEHEPVIPFSTTLLVPVVGIDAVGQPVAQVSHRPADVMAITGLEPDQAVTPRSIAMILTHPSGGLKGRPPRARVRALVNKVHSDAERTVARETAAYVLGTPPSSMSERGDGFEAAVIGNIGVDDALLEVRRRVAAVVLAAGTSTRMGTDLPKQLLPWGDSTVIRHVVGTLSKCFLAAVLVVVGYKADRVRRELSSSPARLVHNPDFSAGEMLSSLQTGVRALSDDIQACLVVLADQPWLDQDVVNRLLDAYASRPAGIVVPTYQRRRGHPVLIDRRHWSELLALEAGGAPRTLLARHASEIVAVPVETDLVLLDMDTLDDYHRALAMGETAAN